MTQEELQKRYDYLAGKVRSMLAAQQTYFRSNKDIHLLKVSKALEAEVKEIVSPKQVSQATFDWLAQ